MRILFLTSAHNSLSQRLSIELIERGHALRVTLATSGDYMMNSVFEHTPDLIIAPMLKIAIPEAIWARHICLIVHPGIVGDRGPSSLDWAIMTGERTWGVTILQASAVMDGGAIWATREFPLPEGPITKSHVYRNQVTEAAVLGVLEAVDRIGSGEPRPQTPGGVARGREQPVMRQQDRAIAWGEDGTDIIVRKIGASDSAPGVLDNLFDEPFFLYGAHAEDRLRGSPGEFLAQRDGAICRATVDGAVWITHLKAKAVGEYAGIKLPAVQALGRHASCLLNSELPVDISIEHRTHREIRYVEQEAVGYLHFDFYNGAMSTGQCHRLLAALRFASRRPTRVIVLFGGRDFFSNGIHLNVIEAGDSAMESWRNINVIDDLIQEILATSSHLVIAGMRGNAGAGGAMLAIAADFVFARPGTVINPHYKSMGGLHGSEYWTYTLPRRVGSARAIELTEGCRPMGAREAKSIGLIDDYFGDSVASFEGAVAERARELSLRTDFGQLLCKKRERRLSDERVKPLVQYRTEELQHMYMNFFGGDPAYHIARQQFVYKAGPVKTDKNNRQKKNADHLSWLSSLGAKSVRRGPQASP